MASFSSLSLRHRDLNPRTILTRSSDPLDLVITGFGSARLMGLDIPNVRLVVHWQQPASAEDYLQEFGRAGRDGRSALAVLLCDDKDTGLLKFMASKTVENASADEEEKPLLLAAKVSAIENMRAIASSRACFRSELIGYFQGSTPKRHRSVAERLVEWIFCSRSTLRHAPVCCEVCSPGMSRNPVEFAKAVFG